MVKTEQIERLIEVIEKSIIINLALKGISYQKIRKVLGGDIHRITHTLKPIKQEIKKLAKK